MKVKIVEVTRREDNKVYLAHFKGTELVQLIDKETGNEIPNYTRTWRRLENGDREDKFRFNESLPSRISEAQPSVPEKVQPSVASNEYTKRNRRSSNGLFQKFPNAPSRHNDHSALPPRPKEYGGEYDSPFDTQPRPNFLGRPVREN